MGLDVPKNFEKLKEIVTEKCGDLLNNDKINNFFQQCNKKNKDDKKSTHSFNSINEFLES